ncbi:KH domain-containing protein At4g18375 isoform X2 [Mangifera indica]|uniref:KH domain-containing protein At4g18375 isoform X2 n=1 Tax=Mangifera indica TaxID=29780 RepID=UPI001CFA4567|nr:KH domain-containing protein At4g18375 isoform X2 [Mangifera indica]
MAGQSNHNNYGKRIHFQSDSAANGGSKRRNPGDETEQHGIGSEDTVYRYLCPLKKIGSIIGRGGEIIKQLRSDTKSSIRISETIPGCDERIITIYSSGEETNLFEDSGQYVAPAHDALFKVHDRIVAEDAPAEDDFDDIHQITIRMLVPADQIGCVIGKGGQVIQNIRSETRAQIRVLKDEHLPPCALNFDELLQIVGEPSVVRKALLQVASRLHENPSRSQHLLLSSSANIYQSAGLFLSAPLIGSYGNHSTRRDEASAREFSLRLVCPTGNIGGVIGKGGGIIKQIRQESGASIKVDSSGAEGDDCIIFISAKEFFEDPSPTIIAALRLQPRCSEKAERESGDSVITTRILVPSSQIGCLIGRGGAIISEMRSATRATIRILSDENLPKVAYEDEEMVQITGSLDVACNALSQVTLRLRANIFEREGGLAGYPPVLPYVPMSVDMSDGTKYGNRDSQSRGHGYSYASGDAPSRDNYGSYGGSLSGSENVYGAYGGHSSSRGLSGQNSTSQRKNHGH